MTLTKLEMSSVETPLADLLLDTTEISWQICISHTPYLSKFSTFSSSRSSKNIHNGPPLPKQELKPEVRLSAMKSVYILLVGEDGEELTLKRRRHISGPSLIH